jgi:putative methionine-R-sulfoxide reductase with GAF domain
VSDLTTKMQSLLTAVTQLNTTQTLDELYQQVVDQVAESFRMDICGLFMRKSQTHVEIVARREYPVLESYQELELGKGLVGWVAQNGQPALVPDVKADPRYLCGIDGVVSEVAIPLIYNDKVIGVLDVESREVAAFDEDSVSLLKAFAALAAAQIQAKVEQTEYRAQMIQLKSRSTRYELIHQIGQTIVEGPSLNDAMQQVVEMVATSLNYSQTAVLLLDSKLDELELISAFGYGDVSGLRIPASKGATGYAVRHGETVNIADVTTDPRYIKGIRGGRSELVIPIARQGKICGAIDVESPIAGAFDAEDIKLLQVVAAYASTAIGAARCEEELCLERTARQQTERETELLSKVGDLLDSAGDPDKLITDLPGMIDEVLGWGCSVVWALEPETGQLVVCGSQGLLEFPKGQRMKIDQQPPGEAVNTNRPVLRNIRQNEKGTSKRSQMAVPFWDHGELFGAISVHSAENRFARSDLDLLALFASKVSNILTSTGLKYRTERQLRALDDRTRRLDLLNRVARSLTARLDLDQLLEKLLRLCAEAFDLSHCAVLMLNDNQSSLNRKASLGYADDAPTVIAFGKGITGHVVSTGVPVLVADVTKDSRYLMGVSGGRAEMAAPLRVFDEVIGVLDAESAQTAAFDEEDLDLFTSFAAQAAVAIHNAGLMTKIAQLED